VQTLSRWRRISSSARRSNRAARRSARGNVQIRNARTGRPLAGGHAVTLVGSHIGKGKAEDLADEITGEGPSVPPRRSRATSCSSPYAQAHAGRQHGDALDRRVVVDVTKLVDISVLEPLDTTPFGSGAEVVADVAPDGARVVKAFNTVFAGTLLAGAVDGRPLDVFLARDDEAAKATVAALAREGGAAPPIDAGRFARARELDLEALGYLHMAVQPSFSDATVATVSSVGRAHPTATTFDEATYASTTPLRVATPVQAPRPSSSTGVVVPVTGVGTTGRSERLSPARSSGRVAPGVPRRHAGRLRHRGLRRSTSGAARPRSPRSRSARSGGRPRFVVLHVDAKQGREPAEKAR